MRKLVKSPLFVRTLIILAVAVLGYSLLYLLPREIARRKTLPAQEISAIQSKLAENSLLASNIASFEETGPLAADALAALRTRYEETHKELEDYIDKPPKQLDSDLLGELRSISEKQHPVLDEYDARYKVLSKVITYDPSIDLGGLDVRQKKDELSKRATAASDALNTLADQETIQLSTPVDKGFSVNKGTLVLPADTRSSLRESAVCFADISSALSSDDFDKAVATREKCYTSYSATKRLGIRSVTEAFRSDEIKALQARAEELIKKLDPKVNAERLRR